MISRRTARLLSEVIVKSFRKLENSSTITTDMYSMALIRVKYGIISPSEYTPDTNRLYEFLFENNYEPWFYKLATIEHYSYDAWKLKEFIMQLHTGEAIISVTNDWKQGERQKLGQSILEKLSADILNHWTLHKLDVSYKDVSKELIELINSLELDGYEYKNGLLLVSEADVLDVAEETGILQSLYTSLALANKDMAFHHLQQSEADYVAQNWSNSISNSRNFLECVLREVASSYNTQSKDSGLPEETYKWAGKVRDYLKNEQLISEVERKALASVYELMSNTGSHPYMAENDQARLLRHLALTFSQFVMLRFKGQSSGSTP